MFKLETVQALLVNSNAITFKPKRIIKIFYRR